MRNQLLFISALMFCYSGISQGTGKETGTPDLPVCLRLSAISPHPPDSVTEFIKAYLLLNKIRLIDSIEAKRLSQAEIERAVFANYKRGEPFPDHIQIMKWTRPVALVISLSIFKNPENPEFSIDSVRWGSYQLPIHFENKGKHGVLKNAEKLNPLFVGLKNALDEILASVFSP